MSIQTTHKKKIWIWFLWLICFYSTWSVIVADKVQLALDHWPIAFSMALGSYAAGSTPMGGGTIGFPVLVLLFELPASLGRDFSFAVQSIGMVSASIFILSRRQTIAISMLKGAMLGSLVGLPIGIIFLAPYIADLWIKVLFAVVWGSFGVLHLYRIREISSHTGMTEFDERWDQRVGFSVGIFASALVVSVTGVGIDMVLYAALVLLCRADLKIAIPTSVIIMAFNSVLGVAVKSLTDSWQPGVFPNWLAAAPIVALGAPLGVFMVEYIGRKPTLLVVAILCIGQFFWTCYAEFKALGFMGIVTAAFSVAIFLGFFEWLRAVGIKLVDANLQRIALDRKHHQEHPPHIVDTVEDLPEQASP